MTDARQPDVFERKVIDRRAALVFAGGGGSLGKISLGEQEEECALGMILRGRPRALKTVGKDLAGMIANLPPPAQALSSGKDHFEHAERLKPPARRRTRAGPTIRPPWTDIRHITQHDGKRTKLIVGFAQPVGNVALILLAVSPALVTEVFALRQCSQLNTAASASRRSPISCGSRTARHQQGGSAGWTWRRRIWRQRLARLQSMRRMRIAVSRYGVAREPGTSYRATTSTSPSTPFTTLKPRS